MNIPYRLIVLMILGSGFLRTQTNSALTFSTTSGSYIVVPYTDTLQPKNALTIEAWINVGSWSGTPGIIGNTEFGGYELEIEQVGGVYRINFWLRRNGNYGIAYITQSAFGSGWHHVAGTYDGQIMSIYLDGVLQNTNDAGGPYEIQYTYHNALIIGAEAGSGAAPFGYYYNGSVDEVRIWNIARPQDSIAAAKSRDLSGNEPGLIGYWRLNEGSGTTAVDASPYHQNGTIVNSPTWIPFDEGRSWFTVGSGGLSDGIAYYLNLAIGSDGTPYAGYADNANSNKATVMKYSGSAWTAVGTKGFSAGSTQYLSMTLASDGALYVAYQDGANSNKLTVQKFNGSAWTVVGSSGCSAGSVSDVQICIASDGTPYVGFADGANSGKPTAMKFDGTNWSIVGTAGFTSTIPSDQDFKLSNDGKPTFALRGGISGSQRANVIQFNGSAWVSLGNQEFSANAAYYISLNFSPGNVPYVSFVDSKVNVVKDSSSVWVSVGDVNTSTSVTLPVLSFAADGTLYIAYIESGYLKVKKYSGSNWNSVGPATITASTTDNPQLAISSAGIPFELHKESALSNKATVQRYVLNNAVPLPVELTSFRAESHPSSVTLRWSTATEVNNYGFEVERRAMVNGQWNVEHWQRAGFVEGNGSSNSPTEYSFSDINLHDGKYSYRLKQIDRDGKFSYSQEVEVGVVSAPNAFVLQQNFPNPFNPSTSISFVLSERAHTTLNVYDMLGREVAKLAEGTMDAGMHTVQFNASSLASGIYFYRLSSGRMNQIKKMTLLQ
jgi:hypothetical protein